MLLDAELCKGINLFKNIICVSRLIDRVVDRSISQLVLLEYDRVDSRRDIFNIL